MATVGSGAKSTPKVTTAKGFLELCQEVNAVQVDLKFVDMLGTWQHCTYPMSEWNEGTFVNGLGFDGSSIRGWQAINASDMLAIPDPTTAMIDPFFELPTVSVIANI
jgi:glutamine synthetase